MSIAKNEIDLQEIEKHKKFFNTELEQVLKEMDEEIDNPNVKFLTHEEVFSKLKEELNAK